MEGLVQPGTYSAKSSKCMTCSLGAPLNYIIASGYISFGVDLFTYSCVFLQHVTERPFFFL